jgi:signal transduction histidine kinase
MLLGLAVLMFPFMLWYSNTLMDKIAHAEQQKVKLWVDAIHRRADLLSYNDKLFEIITANEKNTANFMAQAFHKILSADEDISFYADFITENTTIPLILIDEKERITSTKNIDSNLMQRIDTAIHLNILLDEEGFQCLPINFYGNRFVYLHYKESIILTRLKIYFNDLVQNFLDEIVKNSPDLPVLVTDNSKSVVLISGNINASSFDTPEKRAKLIASMESANPPVVITIDNKPGYVFYRESNTLKMIRIFPFIQLIIAGIFVFFSWLLLRYSRRSEQNQIWIGMSKETAHQLGTPLSSLMAWAEILKEEKTAPEIVTEIEKDISRLENVAQRFSKIGSEPKLEPQNVGEIITNFLEYFKNRTSSKINFQLDIPTGNIVVQLNKYLFEWVLENLLKNAVDAMNGVGTIFVSLKNDNKKKYIFVDVTDTGKGIESKLQKTIFLPGITTKQRGWGLGLTLARRIIKNYHKGKLELKSSQIGKGATFRVSLRK